MGKKKMGSGTTAIHAGYHPDNTGAVNVPIYQSSTFAFRDAAHGAALFKGDEDGFIYTRLGNPTINAFEDSIAALEGGVKALACSSGMGAVNTLFFSLLNQGDHIIITDAVYGPTRLVLEQHWQRFGVEVSAIDTSDIELVKAAVKDNTKVIFVETPANPTLKVTDIKRCAKIARKAGAKLIVDNTFMSPILQLPFEQGADIVMHSITKFINGHSDVVGGVIVFKDMDDYNAMKKPWFTLGATMDPHQAYLVTRGIKTLKMRVLKAQENAREVAKYLAKHKSVKTVDFPGLKDHSGYMLNKKQAKGPGSLISFTLKGGLDAGANLMNSLKVMTLAVSLGGIETLIQHPASMTHAGMSSEQRKAAGITDGLVRLSVGCEDLDDLLNDLEQALSGC